MNKALFRQIHHARHALALTVAVGVLGMAVTIAQMVLLSRIVGRVFVAREGLDQVGPLLLLLLAAVVLRAALLWLQEVSAQRGAIRVKAALRERLSAHLFRLGPAYATGECTGELVATATEGIERLDAYVSRYLPQLALSVVIPLLVAAFVFLQDWVSAIVLLVTAPIIPLLMALVGRYAEGHIQRQWTALARMSAHFLDALQGLPTLIVFGRGAAEREKIARVSTAFRDATLKVLRTAFLSGLVLEFMTAIAIGVVAVELGARLLAGAIPFERAFVILLLAPEFYRPLRDLGVHRHAGMEGSAAAKRIVEVLTTPVPIVERAAASRPPAVPQTASVPTIELTGVTYRYPESVRPALADISLMLPAGARTALVGRSGAGKSTLVSLLLRFMDPTSGQIAVNGLPITELPVEIWRENVALVPQRPYLFGGSVHDNISLAHPTATCEEVERAAELAGAAEFITRLPRGYDTQIGERGSRLSGGEAQRLAIARAFLKNAPLLILDEPTSSLDPTSEAIIRAALERLMHDRTVLVVAHRLNTIYTA
ncbi:MAG TPA: thiol reductant ABC exporter subunit CydD, partial [Chloroflexota bacterium]|nr:thiol reductant ABC exporter subunit CydD [Chloroflexota bacterium]